MRILCATDLLPKSGAAVERAAMIARRLRAHLYIVHVAASVRDERKARAALMQVERHRSLMQSDGIAPNVILRIGRTASQLIGVVRRIAPDLVLLGPRYRRPMRDRLGERLTEKILRVRRCPVLIVKPGSAGNYRDILLALDLSPTAGEIIRTTESIVLEPGAGISVVHAFEPGYGALPYVPRAIESVGAANSPEKAEARRAVRRLLRENGDRLTDCNLILSAALPAEAVMGAIKRMQPDLLVMGTSGYGRVRRALLGSTASQVLDAASCDVLVVPQGSTQHVVGRPPSARVPRSNSRMTNLHVIDRGESKASLLGLSIQSYPATAGPRTICSSMSFRESHTFATDNSYGPNY